MGKIPNKEMSYWSIAEANVLVGRNFDKEFWQFILQQINYDEIFLDTQKEEIACPGFIPFADLAIELIDDLDSSAIHRCQICAKVFDINKEDGIFGDPENLDHFICQSCSETLSAKSFYNKYLVT